MQLGTGRKDPSVMKLIIEGASFSPRYRSIRTAICHDFQGNGHAKAQLNFQKGSANLALVQSPIKFRQSRSTSSIWSFILLNLNSSVLCLRSDSFENDTSETPNSSFKGHATDCRVHEGDWVRG